MAVAELGRDQANWLTVAMALEHGSVMYRDVAVVNTPGLGFIYASINLVTGDPQLTPWIVHSFTVLATIVAGYILVDATSGRAAANGSAVLMALLWPQSMGWWEMAQKDGVAYMFALGAMGAFAKAPDRRLFNFLSGALLAAAIFTKSSAVIYALPCATLLLVESRSLRNLIARVTWISAGFLFFLTPFALYLTWYNAWAAAKASVIDRAVAYGAFDRLTSVEALKKLWAILYRAVGVTLLLPVLLVNVPKAEGRPHISLIVMLIVSVLSAVFQGRGWVYHAVPAVASTSLLVGACLGLVFDNRSTIRKGLAALITIFSVFNSALIHSPRLSEYARALTDDVPMEWRDSYFSMRGKAKPSESREVANWISSVTNSNDRIFVWGMESQIYIFADRMFVGPSFADAPIWHPQLAEKQSGYFKSKSISFLNELKANPPKVFVVARNDANHVEPLASDAALQTLPDLARFIDENYAIKLSTQNLIAYQLNAHDSG
ncbi:hypothetical protein [Celeribacter litoreus]|uniref:hypothetical protein n=1 Tax=Celeribacter litoreus TaxID=2876714 RepID=UPI001CCE977E|nr:hypothetical protein [Celeribacter litoreus]